jgi:hypothetical protein
MYVVAYTLEAGQPVYRLHAIDITTLQDKNSTVITASHTLTSGKVYQFNPQVQRQRPGLLLENGNVYAAFGSFCDFYADQSRGWILGWTQGNLAPLAGNQLLNTQSTGSFFLSSIWMSGSALASHNGFVLAITGNSDPNGISYDAKGGTNFPESIIKVSPDLVSVLDWFTPQNLTDLEANDYDFGAGGILVLPNAFPSSSGALSLAAAAGKDGTMYVLNLDSLGHGGTATPAPVPIATASIGYCWCAQSYYQGQFGPTIISSGGGFGQLGNGRGSGAPPSSPEMVQLWTLPNNLSTTGGALKNVGSSQDISGTPQDGGFFTSVSSLGSSGVVIWALARPASNTDSTGNHPMTLYAFSEAQTAGKLNQLYSGVAGEWSPSGMGGNANIVPVVANGQVYVATYKQLVILGPLS